MPHLPDQLQARYSLGNLRSRYCSRSATLRVKFVGSFLNDDIQVVVKTVESQIL